MSASLHFDSTSDSRRVLLCVHDYCAFRTVQAALQTVAAVVSRIGQLWERRELYAVVKWIPAALLVQLAP